MNFNLCIDLYTHHYNQDTEQMHHPRNLPCAIALYNSSPSRTPGNH